MSSSSKTFCSPEDIKKRNSKTTNEKKEMRKYEKKILQCALEEKLIPMDLKHWLCFHLLKPEFISQIHMLMIYDDCHKAIIVTRDKNVYSLGEYSEYDSSGTTNRHIAPDLKKIEELCGKNIKTFVCGLHFILTLTEEGEVYFWEFKKRESPIRVHSLSNKRVVDIACNDHHFLALTSDGKAYTWGSNSMQSNKNTAIFDGSVTQVKHGLEKKNVVHIACGLKFNMVITDKNKLYGWSTNKRSQISFSQIRCARTQKYYRYPRKITTFSDKIVKMVCGYQHTLALTSKGKIYAWENINRQMRVNNDLKFSDPTVVNVPQMGKVLNIDAYGHMSVAVGYDRAIYVWGEYFGQYITQPFRTKFSRIFDVFAHSMWRSMSKTLIMHDSARTVRITNNYHNKYVEEVVNILKSLEAAFDDPLTSDLTIQVEGRPIYVHKAILKIRCQYFKNMFQYDWMENIQSISDSVYTGSEKFSYVVYKAFLKYLYTGQIDLPLENALELLELADMYYETNLKEDCSQIIKQTITVSNVEFLHNKAIEYNAKELVEFCFRFALRHMIADTLSENYNKFDMNTQAKCSYKATIQNDITITPSAFYFLNKNIKKRKTTTKKEKMQKYEKRILQCVLAEKLSSMNLQNWPFFHLLKPEFIAQIHMVMVYHNFANGAIITTKDKNVYSLDYKEKHSKIGDLHTAHYLRKIKELCGKNIKTFAHSDRFILALTEEGEVYFSEIAKKANFSDEIPNISTFTRVTELSNKRIVDIGCGDCHGLALTSEGKVYEWKKNYSNESDSEENDSEESDWEENDSEESDWEENNWEENDSEESNSEERDLEESDSEESDGEENDSEKNDSEERDSEERDSEERDSEENDLEESDSEESDLEENDSEESDWEENDSQVNNENKAHFRVPRQVKYELEKKKVVRIACGSNFNIVVTDENTIYDWSDNRSSQISIIRPRKYYKYPHEIIKISDKIVKVVCGDEHALALTNRGDVYALDDNSLIVSQSGVNNNRASGPTVVNVPEMGKVLDIAAYGDSSVAVGYDGIIYVWRLFYDEKITIPFPTKFSKIYEVSAHNLQTSMLKPLIVLTNNFNYVEKALNILESLRAIFDDPLTSDLTIRVEGRSIYVHKVILRIRCQYFKNMFQHDWIENIQSISDSVYTVSEKFSYVVYKAFLKYLYSGTIDLPSQNALELMELADMYCETNLIKDCSQKIKKVITVSNVAFFYNKAIECNAKELEEFCFHFAVHHIKAVVLSEEYIKLDTSTKDNFLLRAAKTKYFRNMILLT